MDRAGAFVWPRLSASVGRFVSILVANKETEAEAHAARTLFMAMSEEIKERSSQASLLHVARGICEE